jgi:hypothetical protein
MSNISLSLVLVAASASASVTAVGQSINAPTFSVGDTWTYKMTDQWSGKTRQESTQTVIGLMDEFVRISNETTSISITGVAAPMQPFDMTLRANLDHVYVVNGVTSTRVNFAWPLQVGKKWSYEYSVPNDPGSTAGPITFRMTAEATAWEDVMTTVGKFKSIKVIHSGTSGTPGSSGGIAKVTWTYWYAPEVKSFVRQQTEMTAPDGSPGLRQRTEITAVRVRPQQ